MYTARILDETIARSTPETAMTLSFEEETVTVRELIRRRVYEDCLEYNAKQGGVLAFLGLITPEQPETALNGGRTGKGHRVDWERQYKKAQEAFAAGSFLVLVGERQVDDLDETVTLKISQPLEVTFLKLVPLVGG